MGLRVVHKDGDGVEEGGEERVEEEGQEVPLLLLLLLLCLLLLPFEDNHENYLVLYNEDGSIKCMFLY